MAITCIPKQLVDKFLDKLKSGEINPAKLSEMTSAERNVFFSEIVGKEGALDVNALFESKLLLKNQQAGMITWAKKVAGLKPEVRRDLLSKIERLDKVLSDKEMDAYLGDLISKRLGFEVTEAQKDLIWEMADKVETFKEKIPENSPDGSAERIAYGRAYIDFLDYTNELITKGKEIPLKERFKVKNLGQTAVDSAGLMKSLKSFLDNSAIFRQGWKTMITNPGSWLKNAKATYGDIVRTIGGENVLREIRADIVSRANYDKMVKAGLDVGVSEEAFPTRGLEKLPGIGRLYRASETAYTGFLYKMRADVFDKYMDIATKSGVDLGDVTQLKSIGKMVNSLTGRGGLGQAEPVAKYLNNIFFSPRLLKANWDFLTAHQFQKGVSPFVRRQAATNLIKVIGATAAVLTIAKAINPDSVEEDPRSADFGKIKIGNTRFDVSGGMSSLVTLAMREITQSSKSSTTGLVSKLNSGEYGAQTGMDVVYNFFENKLSPTSALIKNLLKGEDFKGNKLTIGGTIYDLATPLTISNAIETANDPNAANFILSLIADAHGISTNTYSFGTNWNNLTSKEMTLLKKRVGQERFDQMNKAYNQMVTQAIVEVNKMDKYKSLSDDKKKDYIQRLKEQIKIKAMGGQTNL